MTKKSVASIKTLARYEPETVYIGAGDYVAECVRVDDGDYYLAADVDAEIERLRKLLDRMVVRNPDGSVGIRVTEDALNAAAELYRLFGDAKTATGEQAVSDVNVVGMPEFNGLLDHIYEYGTAAEGVVERGNALARAVLARYAPQRYDIDADPNGIRADVTRCVRAAMYCGANNVNPPPEGHWLHDFWLIGRAEASRQDDLAAQQQGGRADG